MHTQVASFRLRSAALDAAFIIAWSLIIGFFSKISIPLAFSPIPIQTQSILIFLGAVLFGAKRGALATALFVAQGSMGFPVFASGIGGFAVLLGPRGGYLVGYVLAAAIIGFLVEKSKEKSLKQIALALLWGNLALFVCGTVHLSNFIGPQQAILLGVAPFIPVDLLKIAFILKGLKMYERARSSKIS